MTEEHKPTTPAVPPAPPVRQTDKLAEALAKAQAEYRAVKRTKTVKVKIKAEKGGGTYSYKYAPLDECIAATRPALSKHGLAVTQVFHAEPPRIVTTLLHASGQFVASTLPLQAHRSPQDLGTEITYMRRYSYSALVSIAADEDTDGPPPPDAGSYDHEPAGQQPKPQGKKPAAKKPPTGKPTKTELNAMYKKAAGAFGWTADQLKGEIFLRYRVESSKDLTRKQFTEVQGWIKEGPPKDTPPPAASKSSPPAETQGEGPAGADSSPEDPGTEAGAQEGVDEVAYQEWGHKIFDAREAGGDLGALRAQIRTAEGISPEQRAKLYKYLDEEKTAE
jgi:hypothetical protein